MFQYRWTERSYHNYFVNTAPRRAYVPNPAGIAAHPPCVSRRPKGWAGKVDVEDETDAADARAALASYGAQLGGLYSFYAAQGAADTPRHRRTSDDCTLTVR